MEWYLGVFVYILVIISVNGGQMKVEKCDENTLVVYRVVLETFWTRELFPKQYPEWRPRAQWSKLIGQTHDSNTHLFRLGHLASSGFKLFAETGQTDIINNEQEGSVFDDFYGPAITTGAGKMETDFFADGNHSQVSVAVRIVPSPDWFIGIDGLNLCQHGEWINSKTINVAPMDAGTDNGFTFTAPNWLSEPFHKIQQITSRFPKHPANSFYYPDLDELPIIASFHFFKDKVYQMQTNSTNQEHVLIEEKDHISNILFPLAKDDIPVSTKKYNGKRKGLRRRPVHCQVSEWSSWSECNESCSIEESQRSRKVTKYPRRGGNSCPLLIESRSCSSIIKCPQKYFRWK